MFVFDRNALAVLLPLALLAAVAAWSNRGSPAAGPAVQQVAREQPAREPRALPDQAVAANLPSR